MAVALVPSGNGLDPPPGKDLGLAAGFFGLALGELSLREFWPNPPAPTSLLSKV